MGSWRLTQQAWARGRWLRLQRRKLRLSRKTASASFRLSQWYGRTGNNLQQLIVVIAHAEAYGGSVDIPPDFLNAGPLRNLVHPFTLDFAPHTDLSRTTQVAGVFFHYMEYGLTRSNHRRMAFGKGQQPRRDSLLGRDYIHAHADRIARTHLLPHLKKPPANARAEDRLARTLVIHLRAGDVADLNSRYYISNPLYYYEALSRQYRRAIIVTESGCSHPLLDPVLALFPEHELVHGSVEEDFQFLRHSIHLATSGVGTFALAAALLSERLEQFHCTDLFLIEHLNPRMIDRRRVNVQMLELPGYADQWLRSTERRELLLHWRPPAWARPFSAVPGAGDPP